MHFSFKPCATTSRRTFSRVTCFSFSVPPPPAAPAPPAASLPAGRLRHRADRHGLGPAGHLQDGALQHLLQGGQRRDAGHRRTRRRRRRGKRRPRRRKRGRRRRRRLQRRPGRRRGLSEAGRHRQTGQATQDLLIYYMYHIQMSLDSTGRPGAQEKGRAGVPALLAKKDILLPRMQFSLLFSFYASHDVMKKLIEALLQFSFDVTPPPTHPPHLHTYPLTMTLLLLRLLHTNLSPIKVP